MKILLIGATGRLGRAFEALTVKNSTHSIIGRIHSTNKELIKEFLLKADIILDVSSSDALNFYLPLVIDAKKPLVTGVTGYSLQQQNSLKNASKLIPILHMPNFSEGISIVKALLKSLPVGNYSITDIHHKEKKDRPSGTALDLAKHLPSTPKIDSIREGTAIGEHTITLTLDEEEIMISHKAYDRQLFAKGALKACCFLYLKEPGLYTSYYDQSS